MKVSVLAWGVASGLSLFLPSFLARAGAVMETAGDARCSYRARVTKQERVGGKLLAAQTIEVAVRAAPRAPRLEYLAGPNSGQRVAWREGHRPAEMRVREGGIWGITSLWIDVDGKLAHKD